MLSLSRSDLPGQELYSAELLTRNNYHRLRDSSHQSVTDQGWSYITYFYRNLVQWICHWHRNYVSTALNCFCLRIQWFLPPRFADCKVSWSFTASEHDIGVQSWGTSSTLSPQTKKTGETSLGTSQEGAKKLLFPPWNMERRSGLGLAGGHAREQTVQTDRTRILNLNLSDDYN